MQIVCGKCGQKFTSPPHGPDAGKTAAQQMKEHPCDAWKYPELQKR